MKSRDCYLSIQDMSDISKLSKSYFYTNKCNGTLEFQVIKIGSRVMCKESIFYGWLKSKEVERGGPSCLNTQFRSISG